MPTNYITISERITFATHQFLIGEPVSLLPEQIIGLVPCQKENMFDCRGNLHQCLNVFAKVGGEDREIDKNAFLFKFPSSSGSNNSFFLQKYIGGVWVDSTILNNNTYGTFYNFNTLLPYKPYSGFLIDWSLVLAAFGEGKYRFIVKDLIFNLPKNDLVSFPFVLQEFTCDRANGTAKFETTFKGNASNFYKEPDNNRLAIFDLRLLSNGWYDSMRYDGSLGRKEYVTEKTTFVSLSSNQDIPVYNKNIDTYSFKIHGYVQDLLNRFVHYGCSMTSIYVTDYNYEAKYFYERKGLVFGAIKQNATYLPNTNKAYELEVSFRDAITQKQTKAGTL